MAATTTGSATPSASSASVPASGAATDTPTAVPTTSISRYAVPEFSNDVNVKRRAETPVATGPPPVCVSETCVVDGLNGTSGLNGVIVNRGLNVAGVATLANETLYSCPSRPVSQEAVVR